MQNASQTAVYISESPVKKMMHPKVANILSKLREPSPVNIPRDETQPITGDLKNSRRLYEFLPPVERNIICAKEITLALQSNALIRKRRLANNSIT